MSVQIEAVRGSTGGQHALTSEQWFPHPVGVVFPFFADAANLEALTPPSLRFRILTPMPVIMREGASIEYALRLRGAGFRWRTLITAWDPPRRFEDTQARGPYALWRHTHTFEEKGGGTLMRDRVEYALPLGWLPLTWPVHRWLVAPELVRIFEFRAEVMRERFGSAKKGNGRG